MKYYVIAGEASGDLHGSNLLRALHRLVPSSTDFRCWGGDRMAAVPGVTLVKHYRDLAFMGFWEVAKHLPTILRNLSFCKKDILAYQPDALILIDYPGFNLRIAKWAKAQGLKVIYYISPQIWAWKSSRVHGIHRATDAVLCILPFEPAFYASYGYTATYVGHPLLDAIRQLPPATDFRQRHQLRTKPIVALLPGSRRQEIERMLPTFLKTAQLFPQYEWVVAGAPSLPYSFYAPFLQDSPARWVNNDTYALLQNADAALVTSGTATLETALLGVPQVVCYAGSPISYAIAKRLVKIKYISLVNLIADRPLVRELIQTDFTVAQCREALQILFEPTHRAALLAAYNALTTLLGDGSASAKAAGHIQSILKP